MREGPERKFVERAKVRSEMEFVVVVVKIEVKGRLNIEMGSLAFKRGFWIWWSS